MPYKPARPCRTHGCHRLQVKSGYCLDCLSKINATYNATRNTGAIYDANWQRFSKMFLRQHPLCECGSPAHVVHHRKPLTEGGDKFTESNLQALCVGCHNRIHDRFNNMNEIGGDRVLSAAHMNSDVQARREINEGFPSKKNEV